MKIDLNKPVTELTTAELAWLLAWQASLSQRNGQSMAYAARDADDALSQLERRQSI